MSHPVYRLSQLLDEAERLQAKISALRQQRQGAVRPDYAAVIAAYNQWAAASRPLLPTDLIERWTTIGKKEQQGQTLPQLMGNPAITPPHGIPTLPGLLSSVLSEQVKLLEVARFRAWPAPSAIPEATRYASAQLINSLSRWGLHVDTLCTQNGGDPMWLMRPRKPDPTHGVDRVMGWLDGILVAARDQEVVILQGALLDVTRHPKVPQEQRDEARALLDQLALVGPTGQVESDAAGEVLRQLTALQQEVRTLRDRVQALEGQRTP